MSDGTARFVALVRGINVGGRARLPMPVLRALLESLGYTDVIPYIQSGNVVFRAEDDDPEVAAARIEAGIAASTGLQVTVMVRSATEVAAVIAGNPYPELVATPTQLHVAFLSSDPDRERVAAIDAARYAPDTFHLGSRAMYLSYPHGQGRSKLTIDVFEKKLGVRATARNWNTVVKLLELVEG